MWEQVLINATAQGGLSEVPREHFRSCSNALRLVNEIGQFGHRPEVGTTADQWNPSLLGPQTLTFALVSIENVFKINIVPLCSFSRSVGPCPGLPR